MIQISFENIWSEKRFSLDKIQQRLAYQFTMHYLEKGCFQKYVRNVDNTEEILYNTLVINK